MTHQEIQAKIDALMDRGDWFDISKSCKEDESQYALYYVISIAIKQQATLNHIKRIMED